MTTLFLGKENKMTLEEHFEAKTKLTRVILEEDLIGWVDYGRKCRNTKHYVFRDRDWDITLCGYAHHKSTAWKANKNPLANVRKKCCLCEKRISSWKITINGGINKRSY